VSRSVETMNGNGISDSRETERVLVKCPSPGLPPVTIQVVLVNDSSRPEFLKGVKVTTTDRRALSETPRPTSKSGTTVLKFKEEGTYEIRLDLPAPFDETHLDCSVSDFVRTAHPFRVEVTERECPPHIFEVEASYISIQLTDTVGEPVPGEPYCISFPHCREDAPFTGRLDRDGKARHLVPGPEKSDCRVWFPNWYDHDFVQRPTINIQLLYPDGQPVANQKYVIKFEDEDKTPITGSLDSKGRARVEVDDVGKYKILFPGWYAHDFDGYEPEE